MRRDGVATATKTNPNEKDINRSRQAGGIWYNGLITIVHLKHNPQALGQLAIL